MLGPSARRKLLARLHDEVRNHADRVAVLEQERQVSYAEFGRMIAGVQSALAETGGNAAAPVGLLLDRSALAYAAMWGAIAQGRAYVPLNPHHPAVRLQSIVLQAGVEVILCDAGTRDLAERLGIDKAKVVVPSLPAGDAEDRAPAWHEGPDRGEIAYVLYTSGSTGRPKGVPISYDNLLAFVDNLDGTIDYRCEDVCSQVCELSFDFSVHEIYLALLNGCALCPARPIDLFNPAAYIAGRGITVWISVPSLARVILNNGVAIGDSLGSIRLSIFNGEALTARLAADWSAAAPNSEIWNNYGPTECTVAVTAQRWSDDPDIVESDVVAIGVPFPGCTTALLDGAEITATSAAAEGAAGELLLATPQCFAGYADPDLPSPFATDGAGTRYYRTGDRALWRSGRLYHLGRIDHQVKIGGHRIELMEVEHQLRRELETESLAVIAHPAERPVELVLFLSGVSEAPKLNPERLGLPDYMMPKRTVLLDALPTTPHGKLDRNALHARAEARSGNAA